MTGTVFLVGSGPGDPELLTLKAHKVIASAQVIVYDRLVAQEIVALFPKTAKLIFAGKSCKQKAMTQEEINALLVSLSKKHKRIVRLKGGDPLLFGRGGEEAEALTKKKVPYEILTGITSAQGCAAIAGIPLTHRGLATGVRFITGHRMTKEETAEPLVLNWKSLADPDTTLVVYMGLANLEIIAQKLIVHGLSASTPAAAIQEGTTPRQKILVSTLKKLPADVAKAKLEAPTLVIIGKVAALAKAKAKK